jgi:hypothetical protein
MSMSFTLKPVAFVSSSIWPHLYSVAMFQLIFPFSFIQNVSF